MGAKVIGIRREDVNRWERRAPLTPAEVGVLVAYEGIPIIVQTSEIRIFDDASYARVGATVAEDLNACDVIFGIKEIPPELIRAEKTYVLFAHVVKGQPANMPMLRRLIEQRCSLIDYERITDGEGRRLVFFGRIAGLVGMIDTLWALGRRLAGEGRESPFAALKPAWRYNDLAHARAAVGEVGRKIAAGGVGEGLAPLIVGITGYGNVSGGAQEVLDLLPTEVLAPGEVRGVVSRGGASDRVVYRAVFKEKDMVAPVAPGAAFDLQDYYDNPEKYEAVLSAYLPSLTVLVNCIYWDPSYPRFVTKEALASLYGGAVPPRLRVIGDISCDVEGGIEVTVKTTSSDSPVYVYDVLRDRVTDGCEGNGPVILAVFNLPAELPREASERFSAQLAPFVPPIARAEGGGTWEACELPAPVKKATILFRGAFTPLYRYLAAHGR